MQEHFPCYYWDFILESRNPFVWGGVPRKCRHSGEDLWFKLQRQGKGFTRCVYIYLGGASIYTTPPPFRAWTEFVHVPCLLFLFHNFSWSCNLVCLLYFCNTQIVHFKWLHCALFWLQNGYTAMIRAVAFQQYEVVRLLCITRPVLKSIPDNVSSRLTDNFMLLSFFLFSYVL